MSKAVSFVKYTGDGTRLCEQLNANPTQALFIKLSRPYYVMEVEGYWYGSNQPISGYRKIGNQAMFANGILYTMADESEVEALQTTIGELNTTIGTLQANITTLQTSLANLTTELEKVRTLAYAGL